MNEIYQFSVVKGFDLFFYKTKCSFFLIQEDFFLLITLFCSSFYIAFLKKLKCFTQVFYWSEEDVLKDFCFSKIYKKLKEQLHKTTFTYMVL